MTDRDASLDMERLRYERRAYWAAQPDGTVMALVGACCLAAFCLIYAVLVVVLGVSQ